jgi:CHAD domain-containing protein
VKARRVKKLDPAASLVENAARIVRVRLAELCSFAPAALEPDRVDEQHDMRIAAKRLRYVLEITEFCFGKEAETARRRARDLQDILGELHDCDVMLPRVEAHIAELRSEDAGLEELAAHFEARRHLVFQRFVEFWAEQERERTWDRLTRTVEETLTPAQAA